MLFKFIKIFCLFIVVGSALLPTTLKAQSLLNANGPGNTYELINSILAPGYTAVEAPDQCASHPSFGRHVAEVYDSTLKKYVFEFYIHVPTALPVTTTTADNDRCLNFDRQRVEIKTYESSPDSLKGYVGNTLTFKWMFRLPVGFKPSPNFTHIHQVKAVGGDEGDPIFTLTVREGSPDILQLIYVADSSSGTNILSYANLSNFLGNWIEATEQVNVGPRGSYSIVLKKVSTGKVLLSYSTNTISTFRPSNSFIRPKWGIYRSLLQYTYLRDDSIRINSVSVYKGLKRLNTLNATALTSKTINVVWQDTVSRVTGYILQRSFNDSSGWRTIDTIAKGIFSLIDTGLTANTTYFYRLIALTVNGNSEYSNIDSATTLKVLPLKIIDFNAALKGDNVVLNWKSLEEFNIENYTIEYSADGLTFYKLISVLADQRSFYQYSTSVPLDAVQYYRLKIIHKDGTYSFSTIVKIELNSKTSIQLYPNPAKDFVIIKLNKYTPGTMLIIYDVYGRKVAELPVISTSTRVSTVSLSKGIYTVKLSNPIDFTEPISFLQY